MDQLPPATAPASWIEALAESEADIEAGRTVSVEEVMRDLHEGLARIEAKLASKQQCEASAKP